MKNGIVSVGHPRFEKKMRFWERTIIREMKRIVAETAEKLAANAKALAPVDDGNLRKSINVTYHKNGLSAVVSVGAEYAIFVNYGTGIYAVGGDGRKDPWVYWSDELNRWIYTRGIRPQPFWEPSIEVALKYFKDEMDKLGV